MSAGRARTVILILVIGAAIAILGWYGVGRDRFPYRVADVPAPSAPPVPGSATPEPPAPAAPTTPLASPPSARPADGAPGDQATAQPSPAPGLSDGGRRVPPSFDVVRVEPTGESVIAGRAPPGATVDILRNGEKLASAVADASGLFATVPPPLPAGTHEIVLQAIGPDGAKMVSVQSVTVVIADGRDQKALVTVTAPDRPTTVLSRPDDVAASAKAAGQGVNAEGRVATAEPPRTQAPANIRIATVDAQGGGRLHVSGEAAPGTTVRLYLNDSYIAPGATGPDGRLSFTVERGIRPGDYRVRLDQVDPATGAVKSRAEVAFNVPAEGAALAELRGSTSGPTPLATVSRPPAGSAPQPSNGPAPASSSAAPRPTGQPGAEIGAAVSARNAAPARVAPTVVAAADPGAVVVPEVNTAIVSRGDNLWRISKRIYGEGLRYTVIFGANAPQIRNPDLIYPGQVFVLPGEAPASR